MRRISRLFLLFGGALAAAACASSSGDSPVALSATSLARRDPGATTPLSDEPAHVVYQVLVRSFWDGWWSGDGTGDFQGVTAKLDYLADLGVDALLLMPIYPSTGGMGYVPTDLFDVDPGYGHKEDFAALIAAAHTRNIRVIVDTPMNHIGDSSTWFQRARQKDCEGNSDASPYCRYFYFTRNAATSRRSARVAHRSRRQLASGIEGPHACSRNERRAVRHAPDGAKVRPLAGLTSSKTSCISTPYSRS